MLLAEILSTSKETNFTVIWLHGLGADGHDFVPLVPELKLPESLGVKFIFPHAPVRPITLNNGFEMPAWFDMFSLDRTNNTKIEDIMTTVGWINEIIDKEIEAGTRAENILLTGFSQGGVIALFTGLLYPKRLAGVMALSTYFPFDEKVFAQAKVIDKELTGFPIFAVHGKQDPVIPIASWEDYVPKLETQDFDVEAHSYVMEHSLCPQEITDISLWLQKVLKL